jgi:sugar (pentulose or hexulose) kinase
VLAEVSVVCTLGLDLGTSSAKAVVIDTAGQVLAQASAGYAVTSTMAGYAEASSVVDRGHRLRPRGR